MSNNDLIQIVLPGVLLLCLLVGFFMWGGQRRGRIQRRIARVTNRGKAVVSQKSGDALTLRRKVQGGIPIIGKILSSLPTQAALKARLERAGLRFTTDVYMIGCAAFAVVVGGLMWLLHRPPVVAVTAALVVGLVIPHFITGYLGNKRIKKFLKLFPDAIDFIVRGLRSGLPVTESMNMVGTEMEEPIGSIFASIGESVKLGVSVEKALSDTARKLSTTEFNFFVTSIVLQRETGGNLSEILNNLSDVLRKRFMMRMKIKAMSSEAKASAIIVGSLPFVVILALMFVSPGYLDPLVDDPRGHLAAGGAILSLSLGIGIMIKMTRFEI